LVTVSASDRAFPDDAAFGAVVGADRRRLDYEPALRHVHLERGVVEVEDWPPAHPRGQRLVDESVQPNGVAPGAER
jgi:hypothetical protein